jgi:nicotinamidase-related amidase
MTTRGLGVWTYRAFSDAVKKTGRKRLIFGGLHTEICLTFAVVQALKDGYEGMYVVDAVGGRSQAAHRTATPVAHKARDVIYWYFGEVAKLKADVGVSEVEKKAARPAELA